MRTNVLTVRFEIVDKEASAPLWDTWKTKKPGTVLGMIPWAMSWGDMFAELRAMENRYEAAKHLLREEACFESLDKLERLERLFPMSKIRGTK